jgi:hypothetical protein
MVPDSARSKLLCSGPFINVLPHDSRGMAVVHEFSMTTIGHAHAKIADAELVAPIVESASLPQKRTRWT